MRDKEIGVLEMDDDRRILKGFAEYLLEDILSFLDEVMESDLLTVSSTSKFELKQVPQTGKKYQYPTYEVVGGPEFMFKIPKKIKIVARIIENLVKKVEIRILNLS